MTPAQLCFWVCVLAVIAGLGFMLFGALFWRGRGVASVGFIVSIGASSIGLLVVFMANVPLK